MRALRRSMVIHAAEAQDEAYAPLEAPDVLPALSLMAFAAALAARPLVRLLPRDLRIYPYGVVAPAAIALACGLIGLVCGVVALRRGRRRSLARIGVLLNGIVVGLSALAALGVYWILRR